MIRLSSPAATMIERLTGFVIAAALVGCTGYYGWSVFEVVLCLFNGACVR